MSELSDFDSLPINTMLRVELKRRKIRPPQHGRRQQRRAVKPYHRPRLRRLRAKRCAHKGRWRVWLRKGHPWAQRSGQQWRYRLAAMVLVGRRLDTTEQVDHIDGDRENDHPRNLRVVLCTGNHLYGYRTEGVVAEWVDGEGFYEYEEPAPLETPF